MTALILANLFLQALTLLGVKKILRLLQDEKETPSEVKPKGTDFWQNIISYDHK